MRTIWRQWWRLGGALGIAFVAVFIVGVALQSAPPLVDDPIDEIREDWVNDGRQYLVADYLLGLSFALFYVPFLALLRELLGRAEGGVTLGSRIAFIGGILIMAWAAWSSVFWGTLAFGDFAETASDETLRMLMTLDYYAVAGMPFSFVAFVGGTSLVIALTGVLWRWLAYLGALEVVLSILAPLSIFSESSDSLFDTVYTASFLLLVVWILLVGIAMVSRRSEPAPAVS